MIGIIVLGVIFSDLMNQFTMQIKTITLCGSMKVIEQMITIGRPLEELGFPVLIMGDLEKIY
jgi:hypothetical protein